MVAMVTLGEKMTLILKAAYFFLESCGNNDSSESACSPRASSLNNG